MDTPKNITTHQNMDATRLQELVEAYGAEPTHWPAEERQAAEMWLSQNQHTAGQALTEEMTVANELDQLLDSAAHTQSDVSFLQARILKAVQSTEQDEMVGQNTKVDLTAAKFPAQGLMPTHVLSSWKSIAATLVMTTAIGFGIGQVAAANTDYASAEALLAVSMQSNYDALDLSGDGL